MIKNKNKHIIRKYKMRMDQHYPYVPKRRMSRSDLYDLFNEFEYKVGVEIGVLRGSNAQDMCKRIPGLKLYCIDPWSLAKYEQFYELAVKRMKKFDAEIIRSTSMDAVDKFENESLDFVYIDNGFHYFDDTMMDLICWTPKVKPGGIISGHDYVSHCGVPAAVLAYTGAHGIAPCFSTVNRGNPSFFWVKQ